MSRFFRDTADPVGYYAAIFLFFFVLCIAPDPSRFIRFCERLYRGVCFAFNGKPSELVVIEDDPSVATERRIQETQQFFKRLEKAHAEYQELSTKLERNWNRGAFGDRTILMNGTVGALASKWQRQRRDYELGYTPESLKQIQNDYRDAAGAHRRGMATTKDSAALKYVHLYTGRDLLGIAYNPTTERFAADLRATDPDAPEVVNEELRLLLNVVDPKLD